MMPTSLAYNLIGSSPWNREGGGTLDGTSLASATGMDVCVRECVRARAGSGGGGLRAEKISIEDDGRAPLSE